MEAGGDKRRVGLYMLFSEKTYTFFIMTSINTVSAMCWKTCAAFSAFRQKAGICDSAVAGTLHIGLPAEVISRRR